MNSKKTLSYILIFTLVLTLFNFSFLDNLKVYAAINSNLAWGTLPSGWSESSGVVTGSGNTLSVNATNNLSDYDYSANITLTGSGAQASQGGLIFRSSDTGYNSSYIVMLHKTSSFQRVELQKFSGNGTGTILGSATKTINWNTAYNLKVTANGSSIKIYVDNESTPSIDVTDTGYSSGKVGIFRAGTSVNFDSINYTAIQAPTPTPTPTVDTYIDNVDAVNTYTGTWGTHSANNYYGGSMRYSNTVNNSVTATFTGNNIHWITLKNGDLGKADVYIDDVLVDTVDLYAATAVSQADVFSRTNLSSGTHTIKVAVKGEKNSSSTNTYVVHDAFLVQAPYTAPTAAHAWNFNGNFNDSIGTYNGTQTGGAVANDSFDPIEGSSNAFVDGSDDLVNFGNVPIEGSFSIAFWVKPSMIQNNWAPIVSKFGSGNNNSFWIGQNATDGKLSFGIFKNGSLANEAQISTPHGALINQKWVHVVCTYNGQKQYIYINGALVAQSASNQNYTMTNTSGNLEIANLQSSKYRGGIDDLKIYNSSLTATDINNLYTSYAKSSRDVSLLMEQFGYRPYDKKIAVFRSTVRTPNWNPDSASFNVKKVSDSSTVKTGTVNYWGQKWGSYWWTADFSDLETTGDYYVEFSKSGLQTFKSGKFKVADKALVNDGLIDSQITNLEERYVDISALTTASGTPVTSGVVYKNAVGTINPNAYAISNDVKIYRDCGGSDMCELESVTITTNALLDSLEYQSSQLSSSEISRIKKQILLGAKYLLDIQQTSSDPAKNGRFYHMGMGWSEQEIRTIMYRDMPHAITVLSRAYQLFKDSTTVAAISNSRTEGQYATDFLASAKKAYACMVYRPYYLTSELQSPEGFESSYTNGSWRSDAIGTLKIFYNISDTNWTLGTSQMSDLRTRDIFPSIMACTALYKADTANANRDSYLTKAQQFADIVVDRQDLNYNHLTDGTYGYFYEFSNNTNVYTTEMHQYSKFSMGNYDPLRMTGVIDLIKLKPDSDKNAKYYNMLYNYGENYLLKSMELTPFGYMPLTVIGGEVDFYRVLGHGANSIYGLAAVNMLEMGNFLNDKRYQTMAGTNINYITGQNPGFSNKRAADEWSPFSWAYGIGESSFAGTAGHKPPKGSISNGFASSAQFDPNANSVANSVDGPNGIFDTTGDLYFHEDGVMHSLSFLDGVVRLEADYKLNIKATNGTSNVPATVVVKVTGKSDVTYTANSSGELTLTNLPIGKSATIEATYNGRTISKQIDVVASGVDTWNIDFMHNLSLSASTPATLQHSATGTYTLTLVNNGSASTTANINFSVGGATLSESSATATIAAGSTYTKNITVTAPASGTKPYLVFANVAYNNKNESVVAKGKITN